MISIINVYAVGVCSASADGSPVGGGFASFIPLIFIFVIFYFLFLRPHKKKTKEHQEMVNNLRVNDRVIITGGIYGKITNIFENTLLIEIAEKTKIKVNRNSVTDVLGLENENQSNKKK